MKIKICLTNDDIKKLFVEKFCPNIDQHDVELVIDNDPFMEKHGKLFDDVRRLMAANQKIEAIKCFRANTGYGLALSKFACENLNDYISQSRVNGTLVTNFMGYSG
jgi:hypothetical protein